jgi:RNA polymerase sigma factor (sigma-70 family)
LELNSEQLKSLLKGCRLHQRRHQQDFYDWLKGFAVQICYRYTNNKEEMEDLVSEGFIRVYKNIHLFNEELYGVSEASFKGWFKKVLVNSCIDWYRKKSIVTVSNNELHILEVSDKSETALDLLSYHEILEAVRNLPPAYRLVFNLFVIEGMSHEEIAGQLNISTGTSKSNLFKAREHLKKTIQSKATINYA